MNTVFTQTTEDSLEQYINPTVFLKIVEMDKWLMDKISKVTKTIKLEK